MRLFTLSAVALSMLTSPMLTSAAHADVVAEQFVEQERVERQADGSVRLKRVAGRFCARIAKSQGVNDFFARRDLVG
ncbi:MAG: hypothetical protein AAGJ87_12205, partial [Pseudomonadota bacterium]